MDIETVTGNIGLQLMYASEGSVASVLTIVGFVLHCMGRFAMWRERRNNGRR